MHKMKIFGNNYTNYYNTIPQKETIYYVTNKNKLKDLLSFVITIVCIIIVGFILWQIPFTRNFFINLYEENPPIKVIADFFLKLFSK